MYAEGMAFAAASCERCLCIALVSSEDCIGGTSLCSACGALTSLLEGVYEADEVTLFNELSSAVNAAALEADDARRLSFAVEGTKTTSDDRNVLTAITSWLPQMQPLLCILHANPPRARRAVGILHAILKARASERHSGVLRRGPSAPVKARPDESEPSLAATGNRRK
jgi:hypothetical protein